MSESANCPLCEAATATVLTRVLRRGHGTVFKCEPCDLGFLIGEERDERAYYDGGYRDHVSHRAQPSPTTPQEIFYVYSKYQQERVELATRYKPCGSSVLEVGASAGQFLTHMDGYRRCAIELDRACCEFMQDNGIDGDWHVLSDSKFKDQKFDLVCCFQTLEHVRYPVPLLYDMRKVLKDDGVCLVEVPNLHEALLDVWKIKEYRDFYFHEDHLFYFSAASLTNAAHRAGFKNCTIKYTQDYNLLSTLNWILNKVPHDTCHVGLSPIDFGNDDPLAKWLAATLGQINQLYVNGLVARGVTSNITAILTA